MTTILNIPLKALDGKTIRELKKKYPEAMIRIEAELNEQDSPSMTEDQFWAIIDQMDWTKVNSDEILRPAIVALSQFAISDIYLFHDILAQKLFLLDGKKYAEHTGSNRYSDPSLSSFSADTFLYARCCVVANGRDFFQKVLEVPSSMPKEFTFESLLYLPEEAFRLKTGKKNYDYTPPIWFETFSNPEGWPGIVPLNERLAADNEKT